MRTRTDERILQDIRAGGSACEAAFEYLISFNTHMAVQLITHNLGTVADAEDMLQNAIIVFYEHILDNLFEGRSSINSYIQSILRKMWLTELRRRGRWQQFETFQQEVDEDFPDTPEDLLLTDERAKLLDDLLSELGILAKKP